MSTNLSEIEARCREVMVSRHGKIGAIKEARAHTGWGLKEAKDWVDSDFRVTPVPSAPSLLERFIALEAENARLRAALEPFVRMTDGLDRYIDNELIYVHLGHCRAAKKALEGTC